MKQKQQLAVLAALVIIAALVWSLYFRGAVQATAPDLSSAIQNSQLLAVENPRLHKDRREASRKTEYKSSGRNPFSAIPVIAIDLKPKPRIPDAQAIVGPQVPPVPQVSPLPVKYFGYVTVPNGTSRRAFFANGEDIFIVSEGDVLLNRFLILKIGNASLEYQEVSSGLRGTAILEEQAGTPSQ